MATNEPTRDDAAPTSKRPPLIARLIASALFYLFVIAGIAVLSEGLFLMWPTVVTQYQQRFQGATAAPQATAPAGNVGGQAPPQVRGSNPDPVAPVAIATMPAGIAGNASTAQTMYDAAIRAASTAEPLKTAPVSLPVNSAGAPVIDAVQVQQFDQSIDLALIERDQAARNAQMTDVASRAPDVSKAEAETMMHRDLCHVPRADPHTCEQGLYKPTPTN